VHPGPTTKTSMVAGACRSDKIGPHLHCEDWAKWGQARHTTTSCASVGPGARLIALSYAEITARSGFHRETWSFSPKPRWSDNKDRQKLALGEEGMPS